MHQLKKKKVLFYKLYFIIFSIKIPYFSFENTYILIIFIHIIIRSFNFTLKKIYSGRELNPRPLAHKTKALPN